MTQYPFTPDQQVQQTDWELYLQEMTGDILAEQSPKCLLGIRSKLYELIINCIPPELILKVWEGEERESTRARLDNSPAAGITAAETPHPLEELDAHGMEPSLHFSLDASNSRSLETPPSCPRRDLRERVVADWYVMRVGCGLPSGQRLTMLLMQKCDAELKHEICHWAAFYEHRLQKGQKPILHLEAFVAKFMSVYKRYVINLFG